MKMQASKPDRLLRLGAVLKLVPVSRASWYRGVVDGLYPKPLKIGRRATAWRESEINELIKGFEQKREDDMIDVLRRVASGRSTVEDAKRIADALAIKVAG